MSAPSLLAKTSPEVLLNKGFPAQFVMTRPDSSGVYQQHPDRTLTEHHIYFDNEKMFSVEAQWGTLEKWEQSLNTAIVTNVVKTLALLLEWPEQRVLKAMRPGGLAEYRLAISGAYAVALGRDPKEVKKAMLTAEGDEATGPATETIDWTSPGSDSSPTTVESTGPSSGDGGWGTATTPTDSGDSAWGSASPTSSPWQ